MEMEASSFPALRPWARRSAPVLAAVALAAAGVGYTAHLRNSALRVAAQNQQLSAQLSATHRQLDALAARVNAMTASEAKPSPAVPLAQPAPRRTVTTAEPRSLALRHHAVPHRTAAEDARYQKLQSQVDAQGKAIDAERTDLASARTELGGSIARTHDELVSLEKRGQKSYFEFDLDRSKDYRREGPLSVRLRKANVKHQFADLMLIVDDRALTQKHVNLYQPVSFYEPDMSQPVEVVINGISKNHIHGYVSAPKYRDSELAASGPATSPAGVPTLRKRLPLPGADPGQQ